MTHTRIGYLYTMDRLPRRRKLNHKIPYWLPTNQGHHWMITVNCKHRKVNQLCNDRLLEAFFDSVETRNDKDTWRCSVFVMMPDHIHMIISLLPEQNLSQVISNWKRWMATKHKIQWQTNFHDHRIRNHESHFEKAEYLLNNPVRAGLCEDYHQWKYLWLDKFDGQGLRSP